MGKWYPAFPRINQPLAAVSSYCSAALNMLNNRSDATEIVPALERAVEQAQRSGQIVEKCIAWPAAAKEHWSQFDSANELTLLQYW